MYRGIELTVLQRDSAIFFIVKLVATSKLSIESASKNLYSTIKDNPT